MDINILVPILGGFSALSQVTLLPGILVLLSSRCRVPTGSGLSALLGIFSFSAVASFVSLLFFHAAGLHGKQTWILLGLAEIVFWLYLSSRNRQKEIGAKYIFVGAKLPIVHWIASIVFFGFGAQLLITVIGHWPGFFGEWDAVVSWNQWALDWTRGSWPQVTWGYPQMIPALWSEMYLWQGSAEIEFFARAWMGLFPLAFLVLFFDAFLRWQRVAPLLAGMALTALLLGPYASVLDSGYVDVPVSFFTLLTGYWVLLARQDPEHRGFLLLCGAVASAAALLTKQGGILALAVLVWGLWSHRKQRPETRYALALFLLLVTPWLMLQWAHGIGQDNMHYVTSRIYGDEPLQQRLWRAFSVTLPEVLLPGQSPFLKMAVAILAVMGLLWARRDERGLFCIAVGLPYLLIWSIFFSYDGRNLLPGLPFLLLASAIGLEEKLPKRLCARSLVFGGRVRSFRSPSFIYPVLFLLLFVGSWLPGNSEPWDRFNNNQKKNTGDAKFNQELIELVSRPDFSGYIFTTYPQVAMIKELRPHFYFSHYIDENTAEAYDRAVRSNQPFCAIFAIIPDHEKISHVLLHRTIYPTIIDAALADGSLQTRLSSQDMRLMQVNCPATSNVLTR